MSFCDINNNQLLNNINMLNEMNPWNSWDCQLVKLDGIEKLISENQEAILATDDWRLCQSLSDLGKRITLEPFFNSEAKILAKFITSLIPVHLHCDPNMPSFISLAPEDVRNNVLVHLEKRELISFSQTSKQMHKLAEKWMPIKTEELLIHLFNLCIENKTSYNLNGYLDHTKIAQSQFTFCSILTSGTQMKIEGLRSAFLPLFENVDPNVIKSLPSIFYDDKPLIVDLIKISKPRNSFKYDDTTYNNKFELAYLDLLIENKVQVINLELHIDLIDQKMAHTFADLIRNCGRSWEITLLNVPVKYNYWGNKVIDNSPEDYQIISKAINERCFTQLTLNMPYGSCNHEIYYGTNKYTCLPR